MNRRHATPLYEHQARVEKLHSYALTFVVGSMLGACVVLGVVG